MAKNFFFWPLIIAFLLLIVGCSSNRTLFQKKQIEWRIQCENSLLHGAEQAILNVDCISKCMLGHRAFCQNKCKQALAEAKTKKTLLNQTCNYYLTFYLKKKCTYLCELTASEIRDYRKIYQAKVNKQMMDSDAACCKWDKIDSFPPKKIPEKELLKVEYNPYRAMLNEKDTMLGADKAPEDQKNKPNSSSILDKEEEKEESDATADGEEAPEKDTSSKQEEASEDEDAPDEEDSSTEEDAKDEDNASDKEDACEDSEDEEASDKEDSSDEEDTHDEDRSSEKGKNSEEDASSKNDTSWDEDEEDSSNIKDDDDSEKEAMSSPGKKKIKAKDSSSQSDEMGEFLKGFKPSHKFSIGADDVETITKMTDPQQKKPSSSTKELEEEIIRAQEGLKAAQGIKSP